MTLAFSVYQRFTGPTDPMRGRADIGAERIPYSLIRSYSGSDDALAKIYVPDREITGYYTFKRYLSFDTLQKLPLLRHDDYLIATIPHQPPAGKVIYQIFLRKGDTEYVLNDKAAIIRFRGHVPAVWMILHIIPMFFAILLSCRAGLEALGRGKNIFLYTWLTTLLLFIGGLFIGPIVQKFAFGAYWTGFPFGHDLTDNKTMVAFIVWMIALVKTWKNRQHYKWTLAASIVMLVVYLIPHSLMGSELDHREIAP